jgi:hypothetical protein
MSERELTATDDAVEALIEERAVDLGGNVDARRAARLLALHGLLSSESEADREASEDGINTVMSKIEDASGGNVENDAPAPLRFVGFRWAPLAAAAAVAIAAVAWWNLTAEKRAVATLAATHKQHGLRRYDLKVERDDADASLASIAGKVDVDGAGRFVVIVPIPTASSGARVVFGRSLDEWWIVNPAGGIDRGSSNDVVGKWIRAVAGDAPFPSMDATFETLATDYDVEIEETPEGDERIFATRTSDDGRLADVVSITLNMDSRRIRSVRWEWNPPEGSIAKVRAVTATLFEKSPLPEAWFEPETHMRGGSDAPAEEPSR